MFTAKQHAYFAITCVEGGSHSWCNGFFLQTPTRGELQRKLGDLYEGPWYAEPALYQYEDLSIKVVDDDGKYALNQKNLQRDHDLLKEKNHDIWLRLKHDDYDADDTDVWLQYCIFGELVYG